MQRYRPFSKATWYIYLFLLSIRLFIALNTSYIHPDEFFQSAEITAGNVFGVHVDIPWEYKPELPCRSILIPAITTGVPYVLLKAILGSNADHFVSTRALFITQRLAFFIITLIIDWTIVRMARQIRRSPSIALLLVSTSYVTLAYHTHAFSNSVETLLLALSATVLGSILQDHEHHQRMTPTILAFGLGTLFSLGIFTRITFVLFGFPFGVMFLYINWTAAVAGTRSRLVGLHWFIMACVPLALGLALTSLVAIVVDSIYFGKLVVFDTLEGSNIPLTLWQLAHPGRWSHLRFTGTLTVTMLNNLVYNMDAKNLAEHGLHPRFFHLLLNYPVLFGNLAYMGVATLVQKLRKGQLSSDSRLVTALTYSGLSGMGFLSAMPHQEARFLTPLILPLVITLSSRISKLGRKFWPLWLLYNGIMAIVFGVVHQAGIVPATSMAQSQALGFQDCQPVPSSLDHLLCHTVPSSTYHKSDGNTYTTSVIFYKTYMPPHHLFGYDGVVAGESHGVALEVVDWRTKSREELIRDLLEDRQLRLDQDVLLEATGKHSKFGQQAVLFRKVGPKAYQRTVLIAPSTVDFSQEVFYHSRIAFGGHVNFDHLDVILKRPLSSLQLNMFFV